jgi:hypothetical protein
LDLAVDAAWHGRGNPYGRQHNIGCRTAKVKAKHRKRMRGEESPTRQHGKIAFFDLFAFSSRSFLNIF